MSQSDDKGLPGLPVHGYKPQPAANVALVNEFKQDEERLLRKLDKMRDEIFDDATKFSVGMHALRQEKGRHIGFGDLPVKPVPPYDHRLLVEAKSYFEIGFMLLNRAVFQPGRIALPEDEESK